MKRTHQLNHNHDIPVSSGLEGGSLQVHTVRKQVRKLHWAEFKILRCWPVDVPMTSGLTMEWVVTNKGRRHIPAEPAHGSEQAKGG